MLVPVGTSAPMSTEVVPYTLEVLAPPYTFPYIVAPVILTVAVELLFCSLPVVAALPPPNTEHLLKTVHELVPTTVVPLTVIAVFPCTVAVAPLPPA